MKEFVFLECKKSGWWDSNSRRLPWQLNCLKTNPLHTSRSPQCSRVPRRSTQTHPITQRTSLSWWSDQSGATEGATAQSWKYGTTWQESQSSIFIPRSLIGTWSPQRCLKCLQLPQPALCPPGASSSSTAAASETWQNLGCSRDTEIVERPGIYSVTNRRYWKGSEGNGVPPMDWWGMKEFRKRKAGEPFFTKEVKVVDDWAGGGWRRKDGTPGKCRKLIEDEWREVRVGEGMGDRNCTKRKVTHGHLSSAGLRP